MRYNVYPLSTQNNVNLCILYTLYCNFTMLHSPCMLNKFSPRGGETICPRRRWQFDGGKNRGGSTSVRG